MLFSLEWAGIHIPLVATHEQIYLEEGDFELVGRLVPELLRQVESAPLTLDGLM